MRFSERWLREWVNPPVDTAALAEQLTMAGLEVDAVTPAAPPFDGVVVAEIETCEPHPDADTLSVCRVHDGKNTVPVVCGAPNARVGLRVPLATVGAILPGDRAITRAELRGVESLGMLCGASELGLEEGESPGLLELPADAPVGQDLRTCLQLDDNVIEVDLTPNRGDCLSLRGLARDVAALNGEPLTETAPAPVAPTHEEVPAIRVEAEAHCPRYVGRVVRGVDVTATSPLWLVERLRRAGIRSIDPVVDVTNYVMLELGQPLHAFDRDRLEGGIVVRLARDGESLTLLDDQTLTLTPDTLVIADEAQPLALAGIMGGKASGVTAETRSIVLESAFFAPEKLTGQARRYGLHTDSSHRFERGVDWALQEQAVERATALLGAITGGEPGPVAVVADDAHVPTPTPVLLTSTRLARVLGLTLPAAEVTAILTNLGLSVSETDSGWEAIPPSWRFDIHRAEDLIEEVARVHGYNRLPSVLPSASLRLPPSPENRITINRLQDVLVERGYQEAITYSFVEPAWQASLLGEEGGVAVRNPIAADMAVMRRSLWPGLLAAAVHNQKRQHTRIRLFEAGLCFEGTAATAQAPRLAGLAMGARHPIGWDHGREPVDFYDVKADLEALAALWGEAGGWVYVPAEHPALHPGQAARIERHGEPVGWLGALHPARQENAAPGGSVVLFELCLDKLAEGKLPYFKELSRFPEVRRDLALVVDEAVHAEAVAETIRGNAGEGLKQLLLFDVYRGKGLEAGRKSLGFTLVFQHPARTLTDDEVTSVIDTVIDAAARQWGAFVRNGQ